MEEVVKEGTGGSDEMPGTTLTDLMLRRTSGGAETKTTVLMTTKKRKKKRGTIKGYMCRRGDGRPRPPS